jgi:hypothetical protein
VTDLTNVRGRLKSPYGTVRMLDDGTLLVRVDDALKPGFWLEVLISPAELDAARKDAAEALAGETP